MEEAPESDKESSHSARANGMNARTLNQHPQIFQKCKNHLLFFLTER